MTEDTRKKAEQESKNDIRKPYEQLLVDVYDELLNKKRGIDDNIRHAMKRLLALFAKIGFDSSKAQKKMRNLTYIIIIIAVIQIFLTIMLTIMNNSAIFDIFKGFFVFLYVK